MLLEEGKNWIDLDVTKNAHNTPQICGNLKNKRDKLFTITAK
jgi:hypothetical protein